MRLLTKGCPKEIPIPQIYAAMNFRTEQGRLTEALEAYQAIGAKENGAEACIGCGQCEAACPWHPAIIDLLKECAEALQ